MTTQPTHSTCARCAAAVPADAAFCGHCGNRLGSAGPTAPGYVAPAPPSYPPAGQLPPPQWNAGPSYPPSPGTTGGWAVPAQPMYVAVMGKSKSTAVLLAVFLSFWTWLYTYRVDAAKFWVGLVLVLISIPLDVIFVGWLISLGVWIWAIIDTCAKPDARYRAIS